MFSRYLTSSELRYKVISSNFGWYTSVEDEIGVGSGVVVVRSAGICWAHVSWGLEDLLLTSFASLILTFSSSVRSHPVSCKSRHMLFPLIYSNDILTFLHSNFETLLNPTILARSSVFLRYLARLAMNTEKWFVGIILHGPSKESLAGFTTKSTKMEAFCFVTTDFTNLVSCFAFCWWWNCIFFVAWSKGTWATVIHGSLGTQHKHMQCGKNRMLFALFS